MKLDDLCEVFDALPFPKSMEQEHPEREVVLAARSRVADAVIDDEFLVDCISRELQRLQKYPLRRGLAPFFTIDNLGIRFAFGYWPPGSTAGPHEHTAWNITAVCRNRLDVHIFDREASYRQNALIPKCRFEGSVGSTGFIYDPCIHDPRNTSTDWSLSLHVTSPRDGERPSDNRKPLSCLRVSPELPSAEDKHPYASVVAARYQQNLVHQLARILCSVDVPQAHRVLVQAHRLASPATRRLIDRTAPSLDDGNAYGPWILERTRNDLALIQRSEGGSVSLEVETPSGRREELVMSDIARDAVEFVTREYLFDAHKLPGHLSPDERIAIGEALEETGLFKRVWL